MKHRAVFITATDTDVGKTVVTALLLAHLRHRGHNAVALKPISSGDRHDARLLHSLSDGVLSLDEINPIHFRHPLAPLIAARMEGRRWNLRRLVSDFLLLPSCFFPVLVEGAGGLLVPLRRGCSVRDWVKQLRLPLLIVARPNLGTINHTALTVEAAQSAGLNVLGVVLNNALGAPPGLAERTNARAIEETCGVRVIATIPHLPNFRPDAPGIRSALRRAAVRGAVERVISLLWRC